MRCYTLSRCTSVLLLVLLAAGCALPARALMIRTVPAQYKPPREPMLVLVENYGNPALGRLDADLLTMRLHEELAGRNIAPLVPHDRLQALRDQRGAEFARMSTTAIAQAVGADQVLYVDLDEVRAERPAGSDMVRGMLSVRVRVIDGETGMTRWPEVTDGHPIAVQTPFLHDRATADDSALRERLHREGAFRITRLFYSYREG